MVELVQKEIKYVGVIVGEASRMFDSFFESAKKHFVEVGYFLAQELFVDFEMLLLWTDKDIYYLST